MSRVSKSYPAGRGEQIVVLQDFSIAVPPSTCLSIVGPNGCGKTTILHIAAGILAPDSGEVRIETDHSTAPTISMVFQDYRAALFPWMPVAHNIAFPLLVMGVPKGEALDKVHEVLEAVRLDLPLDRYPHELSGGQQQLVCLARALVIQPHVLIMDEPFGALDYETRLRMHEAVEAMLLAAGCTVLFVSHEVDEAVLMADEVIVLTRRPAAILGRHKVDIPKPRGQGILFDETFLQCRSAVLRDLRSAIGGQRQ